ncbi:MAG: translation initiation factor IF-3 [Lachnospiraceae bacterium]|nr:translation initiation factor IF-3 [Lachnospiraceae bacterium]
MFTIGDKKNEKAVPINEQIRLAEVRVTGQENHQFGLMSSQEALELAQSMGLDLVLIAPNAKPPVCRIVDYNKYKYEQVRRERENKKKQKETETKCIQLTPNTDVNDINVKAAQARKFIEKGDRVKLVIRFRGRENIHAAMLGEKMIEAFLEKVEDIASPEKKPSLEGKNMSVILSKKN